MPRSLQGSDRALAPDALRPCRLAAEVAGSALRPTNARLMEMRGRSMQGWLRVDAEDLRTKRQLAKWVELGTAYARSLPTKG